MIHGLPCVSGPPDSDPFCPPPLGGPVPDERSKCETSRRIGFYSVYLVSLQGLPFIPLYFHIYRFTSGLLIFIYLCIYLFIEIQHNGDRLTPRHTDTRGKNEKKQQVINRKIKSVNK